MSNNSGHPTDDPQGSDHAWFAFVLVAITFLCVNLLTADRAPVPWQDEVMFADPAINYLRGDGFRSTAWLQREEESFAANSPLYSLLLIPWLAVTGISPAGTRSLNYLLVTAAAALIILTSRRMTLFRSTPAVALCTLLIFAGHSMSFSYRSGRYDMLAVLLAAGVFCAFTIPSKPVRYIAILCIGAMTPWAGLQLVVFCAVMGLLVLVCFRGRFRGEVLSLACGVASGLAGLYLWLTATGGFASFQRSVLALSSAGGAVSKRLSGTIEGAVGELSSQVLLAGMIPLLVWFVYKKQKAPALILGRTLFLGITVTILVGFTGKAPIYYGWMRYLPLVIGLVTLFEHLGLQAAAATSGAPAGAASAHRALRRVLVAAATVAMLPFPLRIGHAVRQWDARDPRHVHDFADTHLRPDDTAYASNVAYYATKPRVEKIYLPSYRDMLTPEELGSVDVLLLDRPNSAEQPFASRMQDWALIATLETGKRGGKPTVQLDLYRRRPQLEAKQPTP